MKTFLIILGLIYTIFNSTENKLCLNKSGSFCLIERYDSLINDYSIMVMRSELQRDTIKVFILREDINNFYDNLSIGKCVSLDLIPLSDIPVEKGVFLRGVRDDVIIMATIDRINSAKVKKEQTNDSIVISVKKDECIYTLK